MDSFANADAVVIKVSFNGDLRRFSFPKAGSFKALYEQVAAVLVLETGAELVLKYADEEGDLITISSDWELSSALKSEQLLRLSAFTKTAPADTSFVGDHSFAAFHQVSPVPVDPFGPFPESGPGVHGAPFGGPVSAVPSPRGPFGAHSTPYAGRSPFAHAGPFGPYHHAGAVAGGCGGWRKGVSREEWAKLKKERKARFSPEEWEKLKEERKRMFKENKKEFKKEHKKFGKHFAGHHGQFGPHFGGHPCGRQPFGHPHPFVHPHPPFGHFDVNTEKLAARFTRDVTIPDMVPSMSPPSSSSSEGEKEADKYESLVDTILAMGFHVKRHRIFCLLQKFDGDVAKVTQILHEKTQKNALREQMKATKKAEKAVEKAAKKYC